MYFNIFNILQNPLIEGTKKPENLKGRLVIKTFLFKICLSFMVPFPLLLQIIVYYPKCFGFHIFLGLALALTKKKLFFFLKALYIRYCFKYFNILNIFIFKWSYKKAKSVFPCLAHEETTSTYIT